MHFFLNFLFASLNFALMYGWYKLGMIRGYEKGIEFIQERSEKICREQFELHKNEVKIIAIDELIREGKIKVLDVKYHEPQF